MAYIFENEKKLQKNRFSRLPKKLKLTYGNAVYYTNSEGRIELVQLIFLKKKIKKFIKKREKRLEYNREKIWFYVTPNFKIQQKSKNSRMGKGKGLIERHTIRIRKNICLFEFLGISNILLKNLLFKLNKKLNVKLKLFCLKSENYSPWGLKKRYTNYYKKYMIGY